MLMIRFQRIGRKNDPSFRMVVLEKGSSPKAGTYVDLVGTYSPKTKAFNAEADRIKEWMGKGAQVSPSLMNLLIAKGILEGKKTAVVSKKNLEKNVAAKAAEEAAAKEAAEKAAAEAVAAAAAAADVVEEAPVAEEVSPEAAPEEVPAEAPAA